MKAKTALKVGSVGLAALACGFANAVDITKDDSLSHGNIGGANGPANEWNEVRGGASPDRAYDLRGFTWDAATKSLGSFGGWAYNQKVGGYVTGDIFIDLDGNAKWGSQAPTFADGVSMTQPNSIWNWDLVVHFDSYTPGAASLSYNIYQLNGTSVLQRTADFGGTAFDQSGPLSYVSDAVGASLLSGTAAVGSYGVGAYAPDGSGYAGYTLSVNMGGLLDNKSFLAHQTMQCGNDLLIGCVPDGGTTLMLLGMGLGGLAFASRRNRK